MAIDTRTVRGRRQLRFESYQDMLADVRALAGQPRRQLGNWSLGQVCRHLAAAMDIAIDGAPFRPAWYIRLAGPWLKNRFISRPMSPGFKLPRRSGPLLPDATDDAHGLAVLERAVQRLAQNPERVRHFVFGPMAPAEWDQLHLRHAEMHLSFIVPEEPPAR